MARAFHPESFPVAESQVLVGFAVGAEVNLWLLYTYRYDTTRIQVLLPRVTEVFSLPRRSSHACFISHILPCQPDSVQAINSESCSAFAALAHTHRFKGLRGRRLLSGTSEGLPVASIIDSDSQIIFSLKFVDRQAESYTSIVDLLRAGPPPTGGREVQYELLGSGSDGSV